MHPNLAAVGEPHLWIPGPPAQDRILVQHPNGVALTITASVRHWNIHQRVPKPAPHQQGLQRIARVERQSPIAGLEGCTADTQRVVGPEVRDALHRVLMDLRYWAHQASPDTARILLMWRRDRLLFFSSTGEPARVMSLPPGMKPRLDALSHVLVPQEEDSRTVMGHQLETRPNIPLSMPVTGHGILEFRARYQALVVSA